MPGEKKKTMIFANLLRFAGKRKSMGGKSSKSVATGPAAMVDTSVATSFAALSVAATSSPAAAAQADPFVWQWQEDETTWHNYDELSSVEIERGFQARQGEVALSQRRGYVVNLNFLLQQNLQVSFPLLHLIFFLSNPLPPPKKKKKTTTVRPIRRVPEVDLEVDLSLFPSGQHTHTHTPDLNFCERIAASSFRF